MLEQFLQKRQASDPFLWAHVALLGAVPLTLVLTMAGLAVGDPVFPGGLETLVMGVPPIALLVWVQWHAPLVPFTLWVVSRPVKELNSLQLQILAIVKRPATGWIALVAGVFLYAVFRQLYITAPLAAPIAPFPTYFRFLGILWAMVFFLISNALWQMGIVAARVLILPVSELGTQYPTEKIPQNFTPIGIPLSQLWEFDSTEGPKTTQAKTTEPPQETPPSTSDTPEAPPEAAPTEGTVTPDNAAASVESPESTPEAVQATPNVAEEAPATAEVSPESAPAVPSVDVATPEPMQATPSVGEEVAVAVEITPEPMQVTPPAGEEVAVTAETAPEVTQDTPSIDQEATNSVEVTPESVQSTAEKEETSSTAGHGAPAAKEETPNTPIEASQQKPPAPKQSVSIPVEPREAPEFL